MELSTLNPHSHEQSQILSSTLSVNLPLSSRSSIQLTSVLDESLCNFWVGLSRVGTLSPKQLLETNDLAQILDQASSTGLKESQQPLLLSDQSDSGKRFVYLLPVQSILGDQSSVLEKSLIKTLQFWALPGIGFYFSPELLPATSSFPFLKKIIQQLISIGREQKIYFWLGSYGFNTLLRLALEIKAELATKHIDLAVYH